MGRAPAGGEERGNRCLVAQPSFPHRTGVARGLLSLPDRAESSRIAERAAWATTQKCRPVASPEACEG
jgi:hypothetical protein